MLFKTAFFVFSTDESNFLIYKKTAGTAAPAEWRMFSSGHDTDDIPHSWTDHVRGRPYGSPH